MISVYKIGGNVIDDADALESFLKDFSRLPGRKILVHGGGKLATRLGESLGVEATMIDGRRVTDARTLDIVTMVYAGLINKRIVAVLQKNDCDAIGLTGADANMITAVRRSPEPVDYGYVGDISVSGVNVKAIGNLLDNGVTPVFCAITHDGRGSLLNCNADSIATAVATAMSRCMPARLVFCFEKPGVLANVDDPSSVVPVITPDIYRSMLDDGLVSHGMIPKIENALKAVADGVESVTIRCSDNITVPSGTVITLS